MRLRGDANNGNSGTGDAGDARRVGNALQIADLAACVLAVGGLAGVGAATSGIRSSLTSQASHAIHMPSGKTVSAAPNAPARGLIAATHKSRAHRHRHRAP